MTRCKTCEQNRETAAVMCINTARKIRECFCKADTTTEYKHCIPICERCWVTDPKQKK